MKSICIAILLFLIMPVTSAQLSVAKVFSDHMVLQRGIDIPVWGTADAASRITLELGDIRVETKTDQDKNWEVRLPRMEAGGPYTLQIYESEHPERLIRFTDVLVGDVWLASGQSNMEFQVQQSNHAVKEIAGARYPGIRFFKVPHTKSLRPETELTSGSWKVCDTSTVKDISAVAYFFARKIHTDQRIPVGIVQTTWGGTPVEAWTSREMLLSSSISAGRVIADDSLTAQHFIKDSLDLIRFWDIVLNIKNETDKRIPKPGFDDSDWPQLDMPKTFRDWGMPFYEGIVWLRKSIMVSSDMIGKDLTLNLGLPEMNYSLYFNGTPICSMVWNANPSHVYTIPAELVNKGENIISVRMAVLWGGGGFNPPADSMYLTDGNKKIPLTGNWKYRKGLEPDIPKIYNYQYFPTFLFNAMVNPLIPYGIKGFIWYQGEANDTAALHYRTLFPMMINDWRIRWKQGYLPFLYVQLPNFKAIQEDPSESDWAELREAQAMTLCLPHTGMVCTIDLGEADNIHPRNKQDVAKRLVLVANKVAYGESILASGPRFRDFSMEGSTIRIRFTETGSGLMIKDGKKLLGFAVAGKDQEFHWAEAKIVGDEVLLTCKEVEKPIAVRYAWADNPVCNLYNRDGLPAVPFRTDSW